MKALTSTKLNNVNGGKWMNPLNGRIYYNDDVSVEG